LVSARLTKLYSGNSLSRAVILDKTTEYKTTEETYMKMRTLVIAAGLALASSTAFAMHCPADMKKIDAALAAKPSLNDKQMGEVKKLRAEGEAFHKEGKHKESVDSLGKAMKILNIQ
jgi:hypothetical protein